MVKGVGYYCDDFFLLQKAKVLSGNYLNKVKRNECSINLETSNMFKPSINFLTDRSKTVLLLLILFVINVSCYTFLSVPYILVIIC